MSLRLSNDLKLPIEAVTEKLGWLGRTGSGKTYGAQKLAEEMHRAGAQFVALDPVGKWWSLRLAADGKTPALPIPVFGGLHGDIPLEPTAGKLIADVIVDRGISAVVDVSQFEADAQKARFLYLRVGASVRECNASSVVFYFDLCQLLA
jgi:DNA helicase HerA-like ATPase